MFEKDIPRNEGAPKPVGIKDVKDQDTLDEYVENLVWAENAQENN